MNLGSMFARHARYQELFALFREAHAATRDLSHRLVAFAEPAREPLRPTRPARAR